MNAVVLTSLTLQHHRYLTYLYLCVPLASTERHQHSRSAASWSYALIRSFIGYVNEPRTWDRLPAKELVLPALVWYWCHRLASLDPLFSEFGAVYKYPDLCL